MNALCTSYQVLNKYGAASAVSAAQKGVVGSDAPKTTPQVEGEVAKHVAATTHESSKGGRNIDELLPLRAAKTQELDVAVSYQLRCATATEPLIAQQVSLATVQREGVTDVLIKHLAAPCIPLNDEEMKLGNATISGVSADDNNEVYKSVKEDEYVLNRLKWFKPVEQQESRTFIGQYGAIMVNLTADTGADVSLCELSTAERIIAEARRTGQEVHFSSKYKPCIYGVGKQQLPTVGVLIAPINWNGCSVEMMMFVIAAPVTFKGILVGMETMKSAGLTWNINTKTLAFEAKKKKERFSNKALQHPTVVCMSETVEIPVGHETICNIGTQAIMEGTALFTPSKLRTEILLPNAVVNMKLDDGEFIFKMPLFNNTDEPIVLSRGTVMGVVMPLQGAYDANIAVTEALEEKATQRPRMHNQETLDKLTELIKQKVAQAELDEQQKQSLLKLLLNNINVFGEEISEMGCTNILKHTIKVREGTTPIYQMPYRVAPEKRKKMLAMNEEYLNELVAAESTSSWSAPVCLVPKKDGKLRFVVDYRALNEVTIKETYPIPRIDDTIEGLKEAKYFTVFDALSGYWQVLIDEESRDKTAYSTPGGHYEFMVMAFGLCNAPATFQKLMDIVMRGAKWDHVLVYIDDILVYSKTFEDHLKHIEDVLHRLQSAKLRLKISKSSLCRGEVKYLGHVLTRNGIKVDPEKVTVIEQAKRPTSVASMQSFLGLVGYYRRFIQNFSKIAEPLTRLTKKEGEFAWNTEQEVAWNELRAKMMSAPVLAYPDWSREWIMEPDMCDYAIGVVLSQVNDEGEEHPIAFASRLLTKAERNYQAQHRECLSIVWGVDHYRHYVEDHHVIIRTDHQSLEKLMKMPNLSGRLARWVMKLQALNVDIKFRPGKLHGNADGTSRIIRADWIDSEPIRGNEGTNNLAMNEINSVTEEMENQVTEWDAKSEIDFGNVVVNIVEILEEHKLLTVKTEVKDETEVMEGVQELSLSLLRKQQESDEWCIDVRKRMRGEELQIGNKVRNEPLDLYIEEGESNVLMRKLVSKIGTEKRVPVLPKVLTINMISECHDVVGHQGMFKTVKHVSNRVWWHGMIRDVKKYVSSCKLCQQMANDRKLKAGPLIPMPIGRPWSRVHMDFTAPMARATKRNNRVVLIIIDAFTKWMIVVPLPNATAETTCNAYMTHCVSTFGVSETLITDRGSSFKNRLMKDLQKMLGVTPHFSTVAHPQTDGQAENAVKTAKRMLNKLCMKRPDDWDLCCPMVMLSHNSSVHSTTKESPFMLNFGREMSLPIDLKLGGLKDKLRIDDYRRVLAEGLELAQRIAREEMLRAQQQQARNYNKRAVDAGASIFEEGEEVWLWRITQNKDMWDPKWLGPYVITEVRKPGILFMLKGHDGKEFGPININRIKPFTRRDDEPEPIDLNKEQLANDKETFVDPIGKYDDDDYTTELVKQPVGSFVKVGMHRYTVKEIIGVRRLKNRILHYEVEVPMTRGIMIKEVAEKAMGEAEEAVTTFWTRLQQQKAGRSRDALLKESPMTVWRVDKNEKPR